VQEFEDLATALKEKLAGLGIEAVTPDRMKSSRLEKRYAKEMEVSTEEELADD
jgi:hypothetical protein